MRSGFKLKEFTSSLFIRLLVSFMLVIALLVAFIWYSVVFYRGNMMEQVIQHNTLSLQKTTENYENLISTIQSSVLTMSLDLLEAPGRDVDYTVELANMQKIQLLLSNRSLYLENVLLVNKTSGFTIEESRGADTDVMFTRFFNSPDYNVDFWKGQHEQPYAFRVFPESAFAEEDAIGREGERKLLPIVVKNNRMPNHYLLAMADTGKIYAELGQTSNNRFYILNERGERLYAADGSRTAPPTRFEHASGYRFEDGVYYFYRRGASGLTYMQLVPDTTIASQIRWNYLFVLLLILTIAISVIVSFLLSVRLNQPVKRMIDAIQKRNTTMPWESGIKEFNIIHDKISDILQTSRDIRRDMSEKESLLRYYAYSNMLKNIRHQDGAHASLIPADRPFALLLVQVDYKRALQRLAVEEERATSFIREYIHRIVAQTFPDAVTFQIEKEQILSVVFATANDPNIVIAMDRIRIMLETEKDYCFLTITASGDTIDWNAAYRTGLERLGGRTYGDDTQIVAGNGHAAEDIELSQTREEELDAHLFAGNDELALQLVRRSLVRMKKRRQSARSVRRFAEAVALKTQRSLQQRHIDPLPAREAMEALQRCYTYEELDEILSVLIRSASQLVREVRDKRDYIIHFVYDYLENHYAADISLDSIADKLDISRSYLSRYFKEKTGEYFVDYVNSVRIDKAKQLLVQPDIRIQEAALLVGYQNANSFNRMFKKFTGLTPSEFRKNELQARC
jgi:AraC-like DNA-binding protein